MMGKQSSFPCTLDAAAPHVQHIEANESLDFKTNLKTAWLTVNRGCNFRCKWCYGQSSCFDPNANMTLDLAQKLTLISKELGIKTMVVLGGEPTTWEPLDEYITFCKSNGMRVNLVSNGYRFSNDEYWEKYKNNPADAVALSVKSGNREEFKEVTGVDLYDKTILGIQRSLDVNTRWITTVFNALVGKEGLMEIALKGRDLGAEGLLISICTAVIDTDNNIENDYSLQLDKLVTDLTEVYPELDSLYNGKLEIELNVPLCLFSEEFIQTLHSKGQLKSTCHVQSRTGIVFDTNGDILPCNTMIGNVIVKYEVDYTDSKSLYTHLNSDEMISNYKQLLRYPSEVCDKCKVNSICKGGCIMNWTIFNPDICTPFI